MKFFNVSDIIKNNDARIKDSDKMNVRENLTNARFTQIDMTDYENDFTGFNELTGPLPIDGLNQLQEKLPELWP